MNSENTNVSYDPVGPEDAGWTPAEEPRPARLPLTHYMAAKAAAVLLLLIFFFAGAVSALGLAYSYEENIPLDGSGSFYDTAAFNSITESYVQRMINSMDRGDDISQVFTPDYCSAAVTLRLKGGSRVQAENYTLPQAAYTTEVEADGYTATCSFTGDFAANDDYHLHFLAYRVCAGLGWRMIALLAASAIICIIMLIFLCCAAGRHRDGAKPRLAPLDKIPLDLFAAICLGILCVGWMAFDSSFYIAQIIIMGVSAAVVIVLFMAFLMTLCARVKVGGWWKNTIICYFLRLVKYVAVGIFRGLRKLFRALPLVWRTAVGAACIIIIELIFALSDVGAGGGLLWLVIHVIIFILVIWGALQMRRLKKAGEELAAGDVEYKTDTDKMYWDFKKHAENLNSTADGMAIAVGQRMRSERLKTELITNVSHDIKTPLTSIINYVDLLQKEHTAQEERQYLEVLARQSARLKKLTEDLVEASKASTGNVSMNLVPTSAAEMINQAVGEYVERFAAGKLEAVVLLPETPVSVMADGRLLWRVLDNLMNNVCKYSMPGTRVYVELKKAAGEALISVKNVSRERLNITEEELMERFVRGDSSRNTEGSGLGLNIAKSLVELQKGSFSLDIDGDLFKATVKLPLAG